LKHQRTIKKEIFFSGIGIHKGCENVIKLFPKGDNYGIKFQKGESPDLLELHTKYINDTNRSTNIKKNDFEISTVEHLLSSIYALGIDNVLIQVFGNEIPIYDGSSKIFTEKILKNGVEKLKSLKNKIEIKEIEVVKFEQSTYYIMPDSELKIEVILNYNNTIRETTHLREISKYKDEVASARTFCMLSDIIKMDKANLIQGGNIDNAIVFNDIELSEKDLNYLKKRFSINPKIDNFKIVNNKKLRFKNEPARHKLLDLIGDLSFLNKELKGRIIAIKPSHKTNIKLVNHLLEKYENS
tara:strand:- start:887 stop:1780 length:894 start_codon:yes stop_codon:yes gene_type:complete